MELTQGAAGEGWREKPGIVSIWKQNRCSWQMGRLGGCGITRWKGPEGSCACRFGALFQKQGFGFSDKCGN